MNKQLFIVGTIATAVAFATLINRTEAYAFTKKVPHSEITHHRKYDQDWVPTDDITGNKSLLKGRENKKL
jgi:hypothetical protein